MLEVKTLNDSVKEAIAFAFVELLDDKTFTQITIKEIVKKAGVCRASFYRNFNSKEEVLMYYISMIFDQSQLNYNPYEPTIVRNEVVQIYKLVKQHKKLFISLLKNNLTHLLYTQSNINTYKNIDAYDLYVNAYQSVFFSSANAGVIIQWVKRNFKETEEELGDIFVELMNRTLEI